MRMSFCMTFALAHHVIHTGPITGGNIMYIMLCVQPYCMCMQHFIGTVHSCKIMQIKLYQQVGALYCIVLYCIVFIKVTPSAQGWCEWGTQQDTVG